MTDTWLVGTVVAAVAGAVGFFVVLRGATFAAHAVPLSSFAGAAGANLIGVSTLAGLGLFAPLAALAIGWLGRGRRRDVATALVVAAMLGLGSLFLSWSSAYAPDVYGLLFGEVVAVDAAELWVTVGVGVGALVLLAALWRPLLLSSVAPDLAESRGVRSGHMEVGFGLFVAAVTTVAVPVVGTLLMFTLMVGPAAAARSFVADPARALALSVAAALATVWVSIALSYLTDWPIGFFVGMLGAVWYGAGRVVGVVRRGR